MVFFWVDDKFHEHRKPAQAGLEAVGLWSLAGSYCGDNLTDGFVPERVLSRWATPAKGKRLALALVAAGLWFPDEHDGEAGWRFHDWHLRNPDAASVKAKRDAESAAGSLGNHRRWHLKRGITVPDCEHCRVPDREGDRGGESPPNPPVPSRPSSVVTPVSHLPALDAIDDDGWEKIRELTRGDDAHARRVAEDILTAADGVKRPLAYVVKAIRNEPERYRARPRATKGTECPSHPGQHADNCGGCAADRKAAS